MSTLRRRSARLAPDQLRTNARVHLRMLDRSNTLARLEIETEGRVKGIDEQQFSLYRGREGDLSGCPRVVRYPRDRAESDAHRGCVMGKLEGKVALVTGGTSGIGLATAKRFVQEGAFVFITGRRDRELHAAVKDVGASVTGVQGDVSNLTDLDRLFTEIRDAKGQLDVLFANAGTARYAPLGEITEELYESIFNTNVKGLVFTVQKALPLLSDGASIILNASIVGSKGLPSNSVYSATKAAVRSFARTWTTDLKNRHIRVNAVSPGSINTPGLAELLGSSPQGQQRLSAIGTAVPLGRLGTPDEIAKAVVFLASDDSSYVAGAELFVDGGFAQV
jgi:NAD(P)-dependent dehydrogenase (short-subunit alcohol dehydrogenase family)